ncbi:major facilitator superfamily domain-containing protein [Echria macrotheca]|uniref:Major facilitator superfamily domain-containing protein n=1 Tax=Echria macrotheca TaxID=438768 RepID=A0AAJ0BA31_9PEZI|nr:major facilitator superfamily domain-containing protein [Echria macrotheca]
MGGGEVTFLTVSYTMVADVTEEAERSMVFSLMNGGFTIVGMASKPLTYLLLKRSPWLSIYAGLAVLAIAVVVSFCLPETLQKEAVTNDASERSDSEEEVLEGQPLSSFQQAWAQIRAGARQFLNFLHLLVAEERQVGVLLLSLLFTTFGMDAALMLIQYAHARFGLGWGEAGILSSIQDVVDLVLFTVLVPLATRMLLHYRIGSRTKDLWLARVSGIIQVLGSAIIGLAPTPAALVAGVGISGLADSYGFFLRSLMTSLMGRDTGILYTAIGLLSSLGIFIANPLLSALFRRGIDIGGPWVGLPFLAAAMLFAIALSMIAFIRVDDSEDDDGSLRGHEDSVQHVE